MKKNTTFHNLFQKIISEEEIAFIQEAIGYKDTARKLDVLTLIKYLLCTAINEFKSFRDCADVGDQFGLVKVNYSALSKKAGTGYCLDCNIPRRKNEIYSLTIQDCFHPCFYFRFFF